jgi:hypothetical protein
VGSALMSATDPRKTCRRHAGRGPRRGHGSGCECGSRRMSGVFIKLCGMTTPEGRECRPSKRSGCHRVRVCIVGARRHDATRQRVGRAGTPPRGLRRGDASSVA